MPASDLLQNQIKGTQGQASIRGANRNTGSGEKERLLLGGGIPMTFPFEIIGERLASVGREKDGALRFPLPFTWIIFAFRATRKASGVGGSI